MNAKEEVQAVNQERIYTMERHSVFKKEEYCWSVENCFWMKDGKTNYVMSIYCCSKPCPKSIENLIYPTTDWEWKLVRISKMKWILYSICFFSLIIIWLSFKTQEARVQQKLSSLALCWQCVCTTGKVQRDCIGTIRSIHFSSKHLQWLHHSCTSLRRFARATGMPLPAGYCHKFEDCQSRKAAADCPGLVTSSEKLTCQNDPKSHMRQSVRKLLFETQCAATDLRAQEKPKRLCRHACHVTHVTYHIPFLVAFSFPWPWNGEVTGQRDDPIFMSIRISTWNHEKRKVNPLTIKEPKKLKLLKTATRCAFLFMVERVVLWHLQLRNPINNQCSQQWKPQEKSFTLWHCGDSPGLLCL